MRILVPVCVGLAAISCIVSGVLWRELRSDEQVISDLRTQLTEAKTALAAKPVPAAVVIAAPEATPPPLVAVQANSAAPVAAPAKITREQAMAVLNADSAKRQKALLADPEYRKALLAQARADLQSHYAALAVELGLSPGEANALFDLLAEAQVNMSTSITGMADGAPPDAAASAEMGRLMLAQQKKLEDQITALIGPQRYAQFEEYDRIEPSRTRVTNLTTLLARSGRPLTDAQTRSLTAAMVTEQKRMEAEAKALRDTGQTDKRSPADIQAETNRRLLEKIPSFLDSQQVQTVRGRFQQRATIDQASDRVQQREREVLQEPAR